MRSIHHLFPAAKTPPFAATPALQITGSGSAADWVAAHAPSATYFDSEATASLETQQMDVARAADKVRALEEEMRAVASTAQRHGHNHLYLLDPQALANGDPGAQATYRALSKAAVANPQNVIAALLPITDAQATAEVLEGYPKAMRDSVAQALQAHKVQVITDRAALEALLAR